MRTGIALCVLALGLLGAGCSLIGTAARLATYRVTESIDDFAEKRRNRQWAEEAWDRIPKNTLDCHYSEDYAKGFKEGFADFLYQGGDGEPPPLPPNRYRVLRYQTPQGYRAIEDWFAGFRHGAAEARQGGYRKWITGPSSLQSATPVPPPGVELSPLYPPPAEEILPPPGTAKRKDEQTGAGSSQPPVIVQVQAPLRPEPPLPETALLKDERQGESAAQPAAPVHLKAQFQRERNAWQIVWHKPDGGDVHSTWMSPIPFTELIKTVMRHKQENRDVGGRNGLTIDNGTNSAALEVDDATFDDLAAYLTWYYEKPAE